MALLKSCMVVVMASLACLPFAWQQEQEETKPKPQKDKIVIPKTGEDAISRRDFMRTKLLYSQNIFEGMTTGNFALIKTGIKEVERVTDAAQWVRIEDDRYLKLTKEFETTVERLSEAAESGNIDAVALRYYQMSTSCIDCHKHIRVADYDL